MHWRIWFDLYKDNKKIGSGVWHQRYTYKCNAIRAAKKRFDGRNSKTYTYIWVVSKTNPRHV
jgi:hypothetical protein